MSIKTGKKESGGFLPRSLARPPPVRKREVLEQALRSELYSLQQMQGHGKVLAESHRLNLTRSRDDRLLARLMENESVLNDVRALLTEAASANRRIVPASDWLLDNFYLIEEHIRTSKRDLPKGYSRALPRLLGGGSAGLPRVYDIALDRKSVV